jgi:hypothetical protein
VLIFAIFGAVLLVYRLRGLACERDVLRLQVEAAAADHVARDFLRLRDYANTPIQTIVFATEVRRVRALKSYELTHGCSPSGELQSSTSSK